MRNTYIFLVSLFLALFITSGITWAGEEGLYPKTAPPGSAFVRFMNQDISTPLPLVIRGKSYHGESLGEIGSFYAIPPGMATMSLGTGEASIDLKPSQYYTAMLRKGHLTIEEDPAYDNKLKAQIVLINETSAQDIHLKTADGSVDVIAPVAPGKLGARAINAIKIGFAVYAGEEKIADLAPRPLERGASYAVVVYTGSKGKPVVNYDKTGRNLTVAAQK